jgi:hypothetical protein
MTKLHVINQPSHIVANASVELHALGAYQFYICWFLRLHLMLCQENVGNANQQETNVLPNE